LLKFNKIFTLANQDSEFHKMANIKNTRINDTGFLTFPKGTTAQRPSPANAGMLRYNTDLKVLENFNGFFWEGIPGIPKNGLSIYLNAGITTSYPGSGTTWFDLSGSGRNFNWVNSPTFNSSGIRYFVTQGNRCVGPASNSLGISNTSGYTVMLFCRQRALTNSSSAFKFYKSGSGSVGRGIFSHLAWADNNIYFDQGGCCNADTRTFVASGGTTTWNMWTFRRMTNSSTRNIIKNTSILATNTNGAANIDLIATGVDLGSSDEFGGNSSTWNAELGAFLVYNRDLSDAEISQVFNALRSQFGI